MNNVRILGLDPGLRHMGWGVIEADGTRLSYVACGVIKSCADDTLAIRLKALFEGLQQVIAEWQPGEAAVEETFVNTNAQSTLKLGHARAVALLVPALAGLLVAEYAANLVKKSVVGTGHADKKQIQAMIKVLLPIAAPASADASDALAVAITHAHWRKRGLP
jgi:crossover junction endodeoxyribonuclease RuvC